MRSSGRVPMEEKNCIELHEKVALARDKRREKPSRAGMAFLMAILLLCLLFLIWALSTRWAGTFRSCHHDGYCDICGGPSVYTGCGVEYCRAHLDDIVNWYLSQKRPGLSAFNPNRKVPGTIQRFRIRTEHPDGLSRQGVF